MLGTQAALLKNKRIRIITISEIRYEGTLYQINTKDKTIALKNVVAFGTEDRRADQVIPPSQNVYELIIFKASHIKNIDVLSQEEENKAQAKKDDDALPEDVPEPEQAKPAEDKPETKQAEKPQPSRDREPEDEDDGEDDRARKDERRRSSSYGKQRHGGHNNHRRHHGHQGYNQGYQGGQGQQSHHQGGRRTDKGPKDFDFEEMVEKNNLLEKEKEVKDAKEDKEAKYNFDDFFDTITTSVNDKGEGGKKDPYQQFKTNSETFGYVKRPQRGGGHRGGRGYGRGGYGGDRHGQRDNRDIDYEDYKRSRNDQYRKPHQDDRRDNYYSKDRDFDVPRGGRGGSRRGYRNDFEDGDRFYEKKN